jgi:sporulation protein YlmC with PRC-barrel domain
MRTRILITFVACAASLTWGLAQAQEPPDQADEPQMEQQAAAGQESGFHADDQAAKDLRVSKLIGVKVFDAQNLDLGKIKDLVLDTRSSKIRFAVLSSGGIAGIGERLYAIPAEHLTLRWDEEKKHHYFALNLNNDDLKNAPSFSDGNWPDFSDQQFVNSVQVFYQGRIRTATPSTTEERR